MTGVRDATGTTLLVVDALDHPHGGRILRVRVADGEPPTVRSLKGAVLKAVSPDGQESAVRVLGFPLFGGSPSDLRIRATGRADLLVEPASAGPPVGLRWELRIPSTRYGHAGEGAGSSAFVPGSTSPGGRR